MNRLQIFLERCEKRIVVICRSLAYILHNAKSVGGKIAASS